MSYSHSDVVISTISMQGPNIVCPHHEMINPFILLLMLRLSTHTLSEDIRIHLLIRNLNFHPFPVGGNVDIERVTKHALIEKLRTPERQVFSHGI